MLCACPREPLWILLLDVRLSATLQRLASVVLLLVRLLLLAITGDTGDHASDGSLHAVADALAEVAELSKIEDRVLVDVVVTLWPSSRMLVLGCFDKLTPEPPEPCPQHSAADPPPSDPGFR